MLISGYLLELHLERGGSSCGLTLGLSGKRFSFDLSPFFLDFIEGYDLVAMATVLVGRHRSIILSSAARGGNRKDAVGHTRLARVRYWINCDI